MIHFPRPHFHFPFLTPFESGVARTENKQTAKKYFAETVKNISGPALLIVTYLLVALAAILVWPLIMQQVQTIDEEQIFERVRTIDNSNLNERADVARGTMQGSQAVNEQQMIENHDILKNQSTTGELDFNRASARSERGGMPAYVSKDETAFLLIYLMLNQMPKNSS